MEFYVVMYISWFMSGIKVGTFDLDLDLDLWPLELKLTAMRRFMHPLDTV